MKRVILMSAVALAALASDGLFAGSAANMPESASAADKAKSLWTEDIDGAFKTAAKDKKPVFVNFTGSDWCYWCILADKNIFSTGQWEKFSEKMVCLKVDFPKNGRPDAETMSKRFALAKQFGVRGYPTFVLLSPERKELARPRAGRKAASEFIAEIDKALKEGK